MNEQMGFRLPDGILPQQVEAALAETYAYVVEGPVSKQWCFYDTFDWRLFNRSLTLCRSGNAYTLVSLAGDTGFHCNVGSHRPAFAWEFPDGELRAALKPILKERALLELANAWVEETSYRILDEQQKTVVRLVFSRVLVQPDGAAMPLATFAGVQPLRGYAKHARRLAEDLSWGEAVASIDEAIFASMLETAGKAPNSYSSQLDVQLDPTLRADAATKAILRRLLETMRANEAGIRADIDTEFLHDYRVAVRRTRSALSQLGSVFPAETIERFSQDFRTLGTLTSELRDLDVYLLAEPDYRAMLPDLLQDDITPLFRLLHARRLEALNHVIHGLDDPWYERFLADWEAYIAAPEGDAGVGGEAGSPIITVARKRIYRRYRRIVKDGTYILDHTEDQLLHALRLECKKLRYLLEFFASIFPADEIASMIGYLKRLQDNLGDFADLDVQQQFLLSLAEELDIDEAGARRTLIATGFLIETMARRQQEVKAHFAEVFTEFASPEHQERFRRLFGKKQRGTP